MENLDDLQATAQPILDVLDELDLSSQDALLALCYAIVVTVEETELDKACLLIDRIAEAIDNEEAEEDEDESDDSAE